MAETHFDPNNIITGSAMLYQGLLGTAMPAMPSAAGAFPQPLAPTFDANGNLTAGWVSIGYTDAGIKFAYDPTYKDVTVDEEMSPVDTLMTAEKLTVSCAIAELTQQNLARLISTASTPVATAAGAGQAGVLTFQHGGQQTTKKYAYLLVGNGPQGFPRMILVYKAVATSKLDITYKRGEKIMTPVEVTSLAYSVNGIGNRLFAVSDKTANATS